MENIKKKKTNSFHKKYVIIHHLKNFTSSYGILGSRVAMKIDLTKEHCWILQIWHFHSNSWEVFPQCFRVYGGQVGDEDHKSPIWGRSEEGLGSASSWKAEYVIQAKKQGIYIRWNSLYISIHLLTGFFKSRGQENMKCFLLGLFAGVLEAQSNRINDALYLLSLPRLPGNPELNAGSKLESSSIPGI